MLLLSGIGISHLGDWIYLIALNLMVLNITNSSIAVAGLYMIKPVASLFTSFWAGSIIDRFNNRTIMILLDVTRAFIVFSIPFFQSIWHIYAIVFIIQMASAFFDPTSVTYMTKLIPTEKRKHFNSMQNVMSSGAFVIGPAIAGFLVFAGSPAIAIILNGISFLLSACFIFLLPNTDSERTETTKETFSIKLLISDWLVVFQFIKKAKYLMAVYALFQGTMIMAGALDSQEVVFTRQVLGLSESSYGVLVSIAGIGFITGSMLNSVVVRRVPLHQLIGLGSLMIAIGYLVYSFSTTFAVAAVGFFVLSFFMAFANTGYLTFYQQHVPVDMMGRIGSVFGLFLAIVQVAATFFVGFTGDIFSVRSVVLMGSFVMFFITLALCVLTFIPSKRSFFQE
ncbi:MFS transporter [Laceyella putida]|uniref:MFS transporter n=1 Tax=Laceyella putida TaxID=110101 RepID=A0ABW2RKM9_9BACL